MRERIEALIRARADGAADAVVPLGWGTVVSTTSLPLVWELNHLRVEDPDADPALAVAEAERRGLAKVQWETPPEGGPPRGRPEREVVMVHAGPVPSGPEGVEVVELGARERDAIIRRVAEDDPELVHLADDLVKSHRRQHRAQETVALGVRAIGGELVGQAWLHRHAGVTQIETVNVLRSHRGRGLGRALVAGGLARCRPGEICFLRADTADWPQLFYGRLGFEPAWHRAAAYLAPGRLDP